MLRVFRSISLVALVLLVLTIGTLLLGGLQDRDTFASIPEQSPPQFELLEHGIVTRNYVRYIVGKVRHNGEFKQRYAQIEFTLLDDSGAQVSSTFAYVLNLEPHAIWAFEAPILHDNATDYRFSQFLSW